MTEPWTIFLVHSTSYAIRIEKTLKNLGISCQLIPVPRYLSSSCGVCVRLHREDKEQACQALEAASIDTGGIFDI